MASTLEVISSEGWLDHSGRMSLSGSSGERPVRYPCRNAYERELTYFVEVAQGAAPAELTFLASIGQT